MGLTGAVSDLHFFSLDTGLVAVFQGPNPGLYRTTDGGQSFTMVSPGWIQNLVFKDDQNGMAYRQGANTLRRTRDGGLTWTELGAPFSGPTTGKDYGYVGSIGTTATGWVFGGNTGQILVMTEDSPISAVEARPTPRVSSCRLLSVTTQDGIDFRKVSMVK